MEDTMSPRRAFSRSCKRSNVEPVPEKIPKKKQKKIDFNKPSKKGGSTRSKYVAIKKYKMPDLSRISKDDNNDDNEDQLSALFTNQTKTNINVCHDDSLDRFNIKKEPTDNKKQSSNLNLTTKRRSGRNIKKEVSNEHKFSKEFPSTDKVAKEFISNVKVAKDEVTENENDSLFIELVNEINEETVAAIRKHKKMNSKKRIPLLLPITKIGHKTYSDWMNTYEKKVVNETGLKIDSVLDQPEDMDPDIWLLIQQFQNSIDCALFDYNASNVSTNLNLERAYYTTWLDLGHKMVRVHRFFTCPGCDFTTDQYSRLENHLKRQDKSLLVYKCLRCHYKNNSKCVMQIHVNAHQYDARYMQQPLDETQGRYCAKCQLCVRSFSLAPHNEIHHNKVFQTNFTSEFISDWREWFCGK